MATDGSDEDDFADLDFEAFSMEGVNFSQDNASYMNENLYPLEEGWSQRESHNVHYEVVPDDIKHDTPHDQDAFFILDSDLAANESSTDQEIFSPFLNESSHFHSQKATFPPSVIDPFQEDLFHLDENAIQLSSRTVANTDSKTNDHSADKAVGHRTEYIHLNRKPGENLGMVLGIEGDQENRWTIDAVVVKSVTPGGAAARSCDSNNRILVGDEISEINGRRLNELTHDQCISVLQDMPDSAVLTIHRHEKSSGTASHQSPAPSSSPNSPAARNGAPLPRTRKRLSRADSGETTLEQHAQDGSHRNSDSQVPDTSDDSFIDYQVPRGFRRLELILFREDDDSLGLSIVPSYGATCDLYQIKRFLHAGACARPGLLKAGDRLLACNDQSLKGLTQAQCLNLLKESGNFVYLTILRCTGDSEQGSLTGDTPEHISTSSDGGTKESFLHSNTIINVDSSNSIIEQGNYLSKPLEDTLISFDDITDSEFQEKVTYNTNENNNYLLNLDDIKLFDIEINKVVNKEDNSSFETVVQTDLDSGSSLNIPPPVNFSDADSLENIEFLENQGDIPLSFTNIDDLLLEKNEDSATVVCNNKIKSSEFTDANTEKEELLLKSFDQKAEDDPFQALNDIHTDFVDTTITAETTEQFAGECFNNTYLSIDNTKAETETYDSTRQSSELTCVAQDKYVLDTHARERSDLSSTINVTIIPVSSLNSSEEYVSKIPISSVNNSNIHNSPEGVLPSSRSTTPHSFVTNISVNSQAPVSISHIDVLSSKNIVQEEITVEDSKDVCSSVIFHTNGGSSSSSLKSATIKVGESHDIEADMDNQLTNPVLLTTVGVTNTCQSGEEEETVKPMIVVKDSRGTPLCIPSPQSATGHLQELRKLDGDSKREIAEVLLTITALSSNNTSLPSVTNGIEEEIPEQEIVPTLLTNDQKDIVLDVLNKWTSVDSSNKDSTLQKAISGVITTQRHSDQQVPENALVHTTLGVSNNGQNENLIEPMTAAKDHQGKHLYIPSQNLESSIQDVRILDNRAMVEIANVMSSFIAPQSALSQIRQDEAHSVDLITEDEIVPNLLSNDQKPTALHVLNSLITTEKPKETSIIQSAVDELKMYHDQNTTTISSNMVESVKSEGQNEKADNSSSDVNTSLHKEVQEIVHVSSSSTTGNNPYSINDAINFSNKSATDRVRTPDTEHLIYEIKETTESNFSEQFPTKSPTIQSSDQVVLRQKSKPVAGFQAKIAHFQQPLDTELSSKSHITRRPRSMIEASPFTTSAYRSDDRHKSFTTEVKSVPALRPLSAIRPLSASTASVYHLSSASLGRPASGSFSSSTFTARTSKSDYPKTRQENGSPFQVDVLKGIVGLGFKVKVTPEGHTQVTEIQPGGPLHKDGQVRVGDWLLFINSTELTGQTDARVQQIIRLLPRGLTKLVVSSTTPSSFLESHDSLDSSSHGSLLLQQPQHLPIHLVTSGNVCASESDSPKDKDIHPPDLDLTIISAPEAPPRILQVDVSEKTKLLGTNQKKPDPVTVVEKPIPSARSEHDFVPPKAMPRHVVTHSVTESHETSNAMTSSRKSENLTGINVIKPALPSMETRPAEVEINFSSNHHSVLESTSEELEQKESLGYTVAIPQKIETHPVQLITTSPVSNKDQITSPASSPVSLSSQDRNRKIIESTREVFEMKETEVYTAAAPQTPQKTNTYPSPTIKEIIPDSNKNQTTLLVSSPRSPTSEDLNKRDTTQLQEKELPATEEKLETVISRPHKIPPPVAPKPRPSSLVKSEESMDGVAPTKPPLRTTAGYEKLQGTTVQRPSSIVDRTGSFVSSTAKMFDNKPLSSDTASEHAFISKRGSRTMVAHSYSSKAINTSQVPAQDRLNHSQAQHPISLSQPVTLPPTSLPRSRTASYKEVTHKEVVPPESSSKSKENVDDKTNALQNPSRLNAALSPRRTSSFDSPTSPPLHFPFKHAPINNDESLDKVLDGKSQTAQQSGIYKSTPLTLVTNKSPSNVSHNVTASPHADQSSHVDTTEHHSKSFTSPDLSPTVSTKEEAIKKFDNLLIDTYSTHIETDPHDLSLTLPVKNDSSQSSQIVDSAHSQTADVKKPAALPRRKPQPKESEITSDVTKKEEVVLVEDKKELPNKKVEEKREELLVEVHSIARYTSETNTLSDYTDSKLSDSIDSSDITEKAQNLCIISTENIQNEMDEICETSDTTEKEYKHPGKEYEADRIGHKLINEDIVEQMQAQVEMHDAKNHEKDNNIVGIEVSEMSYHDTYTNNTETEVSKNEKHEANEDDDTELENQASEIVKAIMNKIQNNPDLLFQDLNTDFENEPTSQQLLEDEQLPGAPPPLPGAPPPPLVLRDASLIVSAQDQNGPSVVPEHITDNLIEKESDSLWMLEQSNSSSVGLEVNTHTQSLMASQPDHVQEDQTDSVGPLNSSGASFYYDEGTGVDSLSTVDVLSEDSGLLADEDNLISSFDVISKPHGFGKTLSTDDKKTAFTDDKMVLLFTDDEVEQFTSSTLAPEYGSLIVNSEPNAKPSAHIESLFRDSMFEVNSKDVLENISIEDSLPPPLLPTSSRTSAPSWDVTTNHNDDLLSQTVAPFVQGSMSPPISAEKKMLEDNISPDENKQLQHEVPSSGESSVSKSELPDKSLQCQDAGTTNVDLASYHDTHVTEKILLQAAERHLVTVASKRKWCLRSSKSPSPILSGESHVPVHADYTENTLVTSLTDWDLKSVIDKANAVLDAATAANSLTLIVAHLHQNDVRTSLGIDIKHEGGIWFQVSCAAKGSPLWEECGAESGDWLLSVDDLWCDQATAIDFQYKLASLKHDLLLVLARGVKPMNVTARPVPSPRQRSINKHEEDEQFLNKAAYNDIVSPSVDSSLVQEPINGCITNDGLVESEKEQQLSSPDQTVAFQQYLMQDTSPTLPIASQISSNQLDDTPLQPEQAPPPLPEQAPPLPELAPPVQVSPVSDILVHKEAPQLQQEKASTSPKKVPQQTPEGYTTPVKSYPTSNGDLREATAEQIISPKPLTKSDLLVKSSPAITSPEKVETISVDSADELGPGIHKVVMIKGATGIGFCLEGGMGSPKGNIPVIIKRIFKGGPAEKCGNLKVRDEILEVNGVKFEAMRHYEAWNHLKFMDDGEVHITIRRH